MRVDYYNIFRTAFSILDSCLSITHVVHIIIVVPHTENWRYQLSGCLSLLSEYMLATFSLQRGSHISCKLSSKAWRFRDLAPLDRHVSGRWSRIPRIYRNRTSTRSCFPPHQSWIQCYPGKRAGRKADWYCGLWRDYWSCRSSQYYNRDRVGQCSSG